MLNLIAGAERGAN